jgi:hypothetical protein
MKDRLTIGKSTKGDVAAALGETLVLRFDTGYEVWVYQVENHARAPAARATDEATAATRPELVILFAPSGVVAKTRIRPVPPG